jgi:hypothetical protein
MNRNHQAHASLDGHVAPVSCDGYTLQLDAEVWSLNWGSLAAQGVASAGRGFLVFEPVFTGNLCSILKNRRFSEKVT